jgi:putative transcriptional regulator
MTTTINRHPDDATLLSFAAGSLGEPLSATVASHVSMCERCRGEIKLMEQLGMAVLTSAPILAAAQEDIVLPGRPSDPSASERGAPGTASLARDALLPETLVRQYGLSADTIPWKMLAPGVWHHKLALSPAAKGDLRLLKIGPGLKMPDHGHGGPELTLVLDGAYGDETGVYARGDLQDVDEDIEHQPIADKVTGCICLIASERPARFKGVFGRLMQSWSGL